MLFGLSRSWSSGRRGRDRLPGALLLLVFAAMAHNTKFR